MKLKVFSHVRQFLLIFMLILYSSKICKKSHYTRNNNARENLITMQYFAFEALFYFYSYYACTKLLMKNFFGISSVCVVFKKVQNKL